LRELFKVRKEEELQDLVVLPSSSAPMPTNQQQTPAATEQEQLMSQKQIEEVRSLYTNPLVLSEPALYVHFIDS